MNFCFTEKKKQVNVEPKIKAPRKPTPYNLYHDSRLQELLALGKSEVETLKICTEEYQKMPDDQKLHWFLLAEEKTPAYLVSCL